MDTNAGLRLALRKNSGYALFYGNLPGTRPHAHHALEIFVGVGGPVALSSGGETVRSLLAVVDSDVPHRCQSSGGSMAVIMLDPESRSARAARSVLLGGLRLADASKAADHLPLARILARGGGFDAAAFEGRLSALLGSSGLEEGPRDAEARMREVRDYLNALEVKRISLGRVARKWALSESRLLHLFSKETGIPFRRYQLWLRLIDSVEAVIGGKSLTEAAHAAGFADYAHFSRTFTSMFGYSLSSLFKKSSGVEILMS